MDLPADRGKEGFTLQLKTHLALTGDKVEQELLALKSKTNNLPIQTGEQKASHFSQRFSLLYLETREKRNSLLSQARLDNLPGRTGAQNLHTSVAETPCTLSGGKGRKKLLALNGNTKATSLYIRQGQQIILSHSSVVGRHETFTAM